MQASQLDQLLDRLNARDLAAAEQVFREYEPYLRMLVRRQLRPALRQKFDSMDVVQSVWADLIEGLCDKNWAFEDRARLQAFLSRLARNRFLDRCRRFRPALDHESIDEPGGVAELQSNDPRPSQLAERDEVWERILALCPPGHDEVLRCKRMGLTCQEIAARTGLHEGSVRRILYELARRYAATTNPDSASVSGPSTESSEP